MTIQRNRQQQADEIILLESMYPSEFEWIREFDYEAPKPDDHAQVHDPSFNISLGPFFSLNITLPATYPETSLPKVYLECGDSVKREDRVRLRDEVKAIVEGLKKGTPILDVLVAGVADLLSEGPAIVSELDQGPPAPVELGPESISRAVIWSHHILSQQKRRDIINWSRELGLAGFSRPGYPGALIIEGQEENVHEFISRLKSLTWQALQVRGDETGSERLLAVVGNGVVELETISEVVSALKACPAGPQKGERLAEWFLEKMRIK